MLKELDIQNIALIDNLQLELSDGLNILSGETGAGKSIIIDSLNFALGERADRSLIRYGADTAIAQAVFENYLTPAISAYLEDVGVDADDVLIIRRKMTVDGRNECRINGRVTNLSTLKGLTELLVDIHGQHEHQSLLKSANHIKLLDNLGGEKIEGSLAKYRKAFFQLRDIREKLDSFGDEAERARRLDVLAYQVTEIENAAVEEGELDKLLAQRKKLRNMEKILSALNAAKGAIDGYDGTSVSGSVKQAENMLQTIADFDDALPSLVDRLDSVKVEISDISDTLGELLNSLDYDSRSAEKLEDRLEVVRGIIRKYGGSYEALTAFYESASAEKFALENADDEVLKLKNQYDSLCGEVKKLAEELTLRRQKTAAQFEKGILKELSDLGMGGSTFKVDIKTTEDVENMTADGEDTIEFLISPNIGEPLKPLAKIISGGEMSRFMLAFKNILADVDGIGTMVFDEIDTGISGHISQVVSQKLCNISRSRQVIAVTHLPSLAAMADSHYFISKSVKDDKTRTSVTLLDDDTDEVARLIGGNDYSRFAIPHATEMKAWAAKYKESLKTSGR